MVKELKNYSLYLLAIVGIVAVVGIVLMVSGKGSCGSTEIAETGETLLAEEDGDIAGMAYNWGNCVDVDATSTNDVNQLYTKSTTTYGSGSKTDYCYTFPSNGKTYLMEGVCYAGSFRTWQKNCAELNIGKPGADYKCVEGSCIDKNAPLQKDKVVADGTVQISTNNNEVTVNVDNEPVVVVSTADASKVQSIQVEGQKVVVVESQPATIYKDLYIENTNGLGAFVCPYATSLAEVTPTCQGKITNYQEVDGKYFFENVLGGGGSEKCIPKTAVVPGVCSIGSYGQLQFTGSYYNWGCNVETGSTSCEGGIGCDNNKGCCSTVTISSVCEGDKIHNVTQNSCTGQNTDKFIDCSQTKMDTTGESYTCLKGQSEALCGLPSCTLGAEKFGCYSYYGKYVKSTCNAATVQSWEKQKYPAGYNVWSTDYQTNYNTCPPGATCYNPEGKCQ